MPSTYINISDGSKTIRLKVEKIFKNRDVERYKITGKNRSITIESNRPFIRITKKLKSHPITWRITFGVINNMSFLNKIYQAVEWMEEGG